MSALEGLFDTEGQGVDIVLSETTDQIAISRIMVSDPVLVSEWHRLNLELKLGPSFEKTNQRLLYFEEISYETLFQKMIATWANSEAQPRTVENFCRCLDRARFRMVAYRVRELYSVLR